MEHTEETDLGAEMFGIASDSEEGCGTGLQQEMVQEFLVLQGERRQFMGEREDNMDVARGEKLLTTRLEPTSTGVGLTLWAVPVAAAVVRNGRMVATVDAFIEMPAQGGGATACDGPQHGDVLPGDPPAACSMKARPAARTRSATSSGGRFIYGFCGDLSFNLSESRGLAVAWRCRRER